MRNVALWTLLLATPFGGSLAAQQNWEQLEKLTPEAQLRVLLKDGKQVNGRFNGWSASAVALTSSKGRRQVNFADVNRVWARAREKGSRWKSAALAGAIGFGIGFAIGAKSAGYIADRNDPSWKEQVGLGAGCGLFTGGIAAGIGALAGGSRYVTVYRWR
jgi:hypothetical protein